MILWIHLANNDLAFKIFAASKLSSKETLFLKNSLAKKENSGFSGIYKSYFKIKRGHVM